jgi:hypothetical protein
MTTDYLADVARGTHLDAGSSAPSLDCDLTVTEVIRPAAVLSEASATIVLNELRALDISRGGHWSAEPACWRLYEPSSGDTAGGPSLIGTIQVANGMPTRYEITIFQATLTVAGSRCGYTVTSLCDEALAFAGLSLASCPRVEIAAPPKAFRMR